MTKIITWVDLQGRYRVTSPAYNDPTRPAGETEDECIARVLVRIITNYGLSDSHVFHLVEDADQRARLTACCGTYFRYPAKPNADGTRSAVSGAWDMDIDGCPKIDMAKALVIHMDWIRMTRDAELVKLDLPYMQALEIGDTVLQEEIVAQKQVLRDNPQTFDLSVAITPYELMAIWPSELP